MPELIIKYKGDKALAALKDFAKYFDFIIEKPVAKKAAKHTKDADLPITFSATPDITSLAGIWKGKDISLEDLRKNAWGERL